MTQTKTSKLVLDDYGCMHAQDEEAVRECSLGCFLWTGTAQPYAYMHY